MSAISRRDLMKRVLTSSVCVPAFVSGLGPQEARADALTPLDPDDATAKALSFVPDASKVDAKANATFKPGQRCETCSQYQGKTGDAMGGCVIFAGRSVPSGGWCQVWSQRG